MLSATRSTTGHSHSDALLTRTAHAHSNCFSWCSLLPVLVLVLVFVLVALALMLMVVRVLVLVLVLVLLLLLLVLLLLLLVLLVLLLRWYTRRRRCLKQRGGWRVPALLAPCVMYGRRVGRNAAVFVIFRHRTPRAKARLPTGVVRSILCRNYLGEVDSRRVCARAKELELAFGRRYYLRSRHG